MRCLLGVSFVVGASILVEACANECKTGEARSGDRCVAVDRNAEDRDSSSTEDAFAAGSREAGIDLGEPDPNRIDGGAPYGSMGSPSTNPLDATTAGGAGLDDGAAGHEGGGALVEGCNPNPCGHGTCSSRATGFVCACDADWSGAGVCDVNSNAALTGLALSDGVLAPSFKADVFNYTVELEPGATGISVIPTAAQPDGVTVRVDDAVVRSGAASSKQSIALNAQPKQILVRVSANDGATNRSYALTVRRSLVLQTPIGLSHGPAAGVAIAGNLMAVGDPTYDRVILYERSAGQWIPSDAINNSVAPTGKGFGKALAFSRDWLIVGVPDADRAVAISMMNRTQQLLSVPASLAGIAFGGRVAVSGNAVLISSSSRPAATGVAAEPASHFVFEFVNGSWMQAARLAPEPADGLECLSAAIEDNLVVAGCISNQSTPGAVILFDRRSGWTRVGTLRPDAITESRFGSAVGISGGRVMATVGLVCLPAPQPCAGTPNVYVFSRTAAGDWARANFSLGGGTGESEALRPRGFGLSAVFQGSRIAISAVFQSGAFGVHAQPTAGAQAKTLGGVYLFGQEDGRWSAIAQLGVPEVSAPSVQLGFLGISVAMDGSNIAASAMDEINGDAAGVYVFGPNCSQVPAGTTVPGC